MAAQEHPHPAGLWSKRRLAAGIAVLVVLAVIAGALVLRARSESTVASLGGPSATARAGGLQMSIAVSPGPYFLSELLEVQLTLANQSQTTYSVEGFLQPNYCASALQVGQSGGEPPDYQWPMLPLLQSRSCVRASSTLAPGERWSSVQFIPLTASGWVTLSAQANIVASTGGVGPFTRGWPSVTLQVAPQVPANRAIALAAANGRLSISAPPGARAHLYYVYIVTCSQGGGTGEAVISDYWQPIASTVLAEPNCSGTQERWRYSVAAPGYAIASGVLGGR
jgi:hypothetical protein